MRTEYMPFEEIAGINIVKRVPLAIEQVELMRNDATKVMLLGRYGVIDNAGNIICPIEYDNIIDFNEDCFCALKNQKWGVVDYMGNVILDFKYDVAPVSKWEYIGEKSLKVKFDNVTGKYGYVDDTDKYVLPPQYNSWSSDFINGYAPFGSSVCTPYKEEEEIGEFTRLGLMDEDGNTVLNPIFNWFQDVRNDYVWAFSRGRYYLIQLKSHNAIEFAEREIEKSILPSTFDKVILKNLNVPIEIIRFHTGESCYRYRYNDHWGILNINGEMLTQPIFEQINWDRMAPLFGIMLVQTDFKMGCVDSLGRIIVPMQYDYVFFGFDWGHCEFGPYHELIYGVRYDDIIDVYDKNGKLIRTKKRKATIFQNRI